MIHGEYCQPLLLMPIPTTQDRNRRRLVWAVWLIAALAGLKYGFDFGSRISGLWMGIAMAITTAVFCSMMAGGMVQRLLRAKPTRHDGG